MKNEEKKKKNEHEMVVFSLQVPVFVFVFHFPLSIATSFYYSFWGLVSWSVCAFHIIPALLLLFSFCFFFFSKTD